jgi:hypothetical protein
MKAPNMTRARKTSDGRRRGSRSCSRHSPLSSADRSLSIELLTELRTFLSEAYKPVDKIRFFPKLSDNADITKLPQRFHRHDLGYYDRNNRWHWNRIVSAFETTLTSKRFNSTIKALYELNALGYDIYICPNPLSSRERMQCTVIGMRWLVIESDTNTLAEQHDFLDRHRQHFRLAVWSGNRSLQCWLPILPIRNPSCLFKWRVINEAKRDGESCPGCEEYEQLANKVERLCGLEGIHPDTKVTQNFACLIRCPGFKHTKTGKEARLIHFRPIKSTNIVLTGSPLPPSSEQLTDEVQEPAQEIPSASSTSSVSSSSTPSTLSNLTWLDWLWKFNELQRTGIPRRYTRYALQRAAITTANVFHWSNDKLQQEWRQVIELHPEHIGCDVEYEIEDVVRHREEAGDFTPHLPRVPTMLADWREETLRENLKQLGCPNSKGITRLLFRVFYPQACQAVGAANTYGTLTVQSARMQGVCHEYKSALGWLEAVNIAKLVHAGYIVGERSRQYWVNLPALLFLLGFKSAELEWRSDAGATTSAPRIAAAPIRRDNDECFDVCADWHCSESMSASREIYPPGDLAPASLSVDIVSVISASLPNSVHDQQSDQKTTQVRSEAVRERYGDDQHHTALVTNAAKLRAIMKFFGLSPTEVAKACGVSRSYVSRIISEGDVFLGGDAFYRRVEQTLGSLVEKRTRQVFAVQPTAISDLG